MIRTSHLLVPTCPTLFSPLQIQSRELLRLGLSGFIGWLRENLVSLQRIVEEHRATIVVVGAHLEFLGRCDFHDADCLEVTTTGTVHKAGAMVESNSRFQAAGRDVAHVRMFFRSVVIEDPHSFSAKPSVLPAGLMSRFDPEEVGSGRVRRQVPVLLEEFEGRGEPLLTGTHPLTIHRYGVDFADQWTFTEAAAYVGASRESLVLNRNGNGAGIQSGLSQPLTRFDIEMRRPYFLLDEGTVDTRVYRLDHRLAFVHRLVSRVAGQEVLHATAIEQTEVEAS